MDWLQFISSVIGSLAWPIAAAALGFMFREQVKSLLQKVKHAKGAGIELDFADDFKRIVLEGEQVAQQEAPTSEVRTLPNPADDKDKLYEILRERPAALILDAWRDVEKSAQDVIIALGRGASLAFQRQRPPPPTGWPSLLVESGVLSHEEAGLLVNLRTLRNKVAHATDWEPATSDALDYHRTASLLASVLRKKLGEIENLKH